MVLKMHAATPATPSPRHCWPTASTSGHQHQARPPPRHLLRPGAEEPDGLVQIEEPFPEPMLPPRPSSCTTARRDQPPRPGPARRLIRTRPLRRRPRPLRPARGRRRPGRARRRADRRPSGARVVLADDQPEPGGSLLGTETARRRPARSWVQRPPPNWPAPDVLLLQRTTVFGYYDDGLPPRPSSGAPTTSARAPRQPVPAAGLAHPRPTRARGDRRPRAPLVFADNDRPGIMLAGAARTYLHRYGVLPGRAAVVFTTNDSAYAAAVDLADAGVEVAPSSTPGRSRGEWAPSVREPRHRGPRPAGRHRHGRRRAGDRRARRAVRDGVPGEPSASPATCCWSPAAGTPPCTCSARRAAGCATTTRSARSCPATRWPDERRRGGGRGVRPGGLPRRGPAGGRGRARGLGVAAGARRGRASDRGRRARAHPDRWCCGGCRTPTGRTAAPSSSTCSATPRSPTSPAPSGAGMRSVEHVKRYTTIGTAHDQGKTSGVHRLRHRRRALGVGIADARHHHVPAALHPGRVRGAGRPRPRGAVRPERHHRRCTTGTSRTARGSRTSGSGSARWYYPQPGEDMQAAVLRECARRPRRRRHHGRLHPRQDRRAGPGRRRRSWTCSTPT